MPADIIVLLAHSDCARQVDSKAGRETVAYLCEFGKVIFLFYKKLPNYTAIVNTFFGRIFVF